MGPAQGVQVNAFPLATTLAGVGVDVCQGGACTPAIPIYVRQDQINAILPSNAPLGDVSLRVTYNGIAGNFTSASVISRGVGLFTINSAGFGPAVAQNFVSPTDQPVNSADTPAKPGQTVVLWATGLGPGRRGVATRVLRRRRLHRPLVLPTPQFAFDSFNPQPAIHKSHRRLTLPG